MTDLKGSTNPKPRRKQKGQRPKTQPQRTCIACRDKTAKRTLIRIVRTPDGQVAVDLTGRANGRGAYLCDNPLCWNRALHSSLLAHALRTEPDKASVTRLRDFAAQLTPVEPGETTQPEGVL